MKKIFAFLFVSSILFAFSSTSALATKKPEKEDILLMKHTVLTLWNMGLNTSHSMDNTALYINTLRFLIRGQVNHNGEFREDYPNRFINIPEKFNLFFDQELVERTGRIVFDGWMDSSTLPPGIFLGAKGYYVEDEILNQPFPTESYLPSFAAVDSLQQLQNGTVILSGKLRRFKQNPSTLEEIPWASAPFMARFSPTEEGWQLTSFVITEEALG